MSPGTQWRIVIGAIVAIAVIAAAVYVNRGYSKIENEAYRLRNEAKAAFSETSTTDEVRKWLQERGWTLGTSPQGDWVSAYYPKDAGPRDPPQYLIIRAYKQMGTDAKLPVERWISLHIRFNPDKTYQSLYLDSTAPPPPGWKG